MTQSNILELAKQGDARAITSLLNRSLQPKGITAKAAKRDGILHVLLEGETPPNQPASIRCIHQGLQKLGFVDTPITIYGREQGSAEVCWQSHLDAPLIGEAPMMADSSESEHPLPPPPPPTAKVEGNEESSWDNFDLPASDSDATPADPEDQSAATHEDSVAAQAWNNDFAGDDFALDSPDEPTLIVPPQPDEELDSDNLSDEDSDSEILLSLWDDAELDDDDMIEASVDGNGEDLDLWQDGGSGSIEASDEGLGDSPGLIGEPQAKRKGSTLLPLLLLVVLGALGGAAAASRMGMVRLPWLTNIPGLGRFLTPVDEAETINNSPSQAVSKANSTGITNANGVGQSGSAGDTDVAASDTVVSNNTNSTNKVEGNQPAPETPFRDGVNSATEASTLAQFASSTEDWNIVAEHWSDAVEGMKAVPSDHPRYEVAQTKVSEYQKNLDYARRLAQP